MRRALVMALLAGGITLAGPVTTGVAQAAGPSTAVLTQTPSPGVDIDEPLSQDGDDDTGRYGLVGLSGLLGLFGYKKYQQHRTSTQGKRVGGVDTDGSGSQRV